MGILEFLRMKFEGMCAMSFSISAAFLNLLSLNPSIADNHPMTFDAFGATFSIAPLVIPVTSETTLSVSSVIEVTDAELMAAITPPAAAIDAPAVNIAKPMPIAPKTIPVMACQLK